MKWFKRILICILLLVVGVLAFSAATWYMVRGTPEWYRPAKGYDEAVARRAEEEVTHVQSWVAKAQTQPSTQSVEPITITLTSDELNAFFTKWKTAKNWDAKIDRYLANPQIVLHNKRLILAGTVRNLQVMDGTVMSLHFEPRLDADGKLNLDLVKVLAGKVPMPEAVWSGELDRLKGVMSASLPEMQGKSKVLPDGSFNSEAASVAMAKLLLHTLNHEATAPVVFVPFDEDQKHRIKVMPMKLTGITVADQTLKLTAVPLDEKQRREELDRIREPIDSPTAVAKTGE
ncbi:MAG TPA: hypothetical protein VIL86_04270 [Tepidisphaeraceae bacterium]|jgi:hypothetical protein